MSDPYYESQKQYGPALTAAANQRRTEELKQAAIKRQNRAQLKRTKIMQNDNPTDKAHEIFQKYAKDEEYYPGEFDNFENLFTQIVTLAWDLHTHNDGQCGGPYHIWLDDGNTYTPFCPPWYGQENEYKYQICPQVVDICQRIFDLAQHATESEQYLIYAIGSHIYDKAPVLCDCGDPI